jgi:5'-3' exonuclease
LARAITGDKSDNLKGVERVGLKTLIKLFPFFCAKEKVDIEYVFKYCEEHLNDNKKYEQVLASKNQIANNFKVMRLDNILISSQSIDRIKENVNMKTVLNSTAFRAKLIADGMNSISENFFDPFRVISYKNSL